MKGIVFTEFLNMVEQAQGYSIVDQLILDVKPASQGAYTAVGTYDHQELVALVVAYAGKTNSEVPEVLRLFGHHLFIAFLDNYPHFFQEAFTAFDFLKSVDSYIHIEVAKLYPDAQLPQFNVSIRDNNVLEMIYASDRSMSALALGLIEKTMEHYDEQATIESQFQREDGSQVKFVITKH